MRKVYRRIVWNGVGHYLTSDFNNNSREELIPNLLYYIPISDADFNTNGSMTTYATINENGDYIEYTTEDEEQTDRLIHELEVQGYSYYEILESLRI